VGERGGFVKNEDDTCPPSPPERSCVTDKTNCPCDKESVRGEQEREKEKEREEKKERAVRTSVRTEGKQERVRAFARNITLEEGCKKREN
jgi:hypothetical protein